MDSDPGCFQDCRGIWRIGYAHASPKYLLCSCHSSCVYWLSDSCFICCLIFVGLTFPICSCMSIFLYLIFLKRQIWLCRCICLKIYIYITSHCLWDKVSSQFTYILDNLSNFMSHHPHSLHNLCLIRIDLLHWQFAIHTITFCLSHLSGRLTLSAQHISHPPCLLSHLFTPVLEGASPFLGSLPLLSQARWDILPSVPTAPCAYICCVLTNSIQGTYDPSLSPLACKLLTDRNHVLSSYSSA